MQPTTRKKTRKSVKYITDTLAAADFMGADRIVVHSGACAKMDRRVAMEYATLKIALERSKELGLSHVHICPETMGKINQLGDLDEVIELCRLDDYLLPTIDFGHLNARGLGSLKEYSDYLEIFDKIENGLGHDRLNIFHSHFSRIEFTQGGEKEASHACRHNVRSRIFLPIAEIIYKKKIFRPQSSASRTEQWRRTLSK
ncbi:MAG: TIM barrel protein [Clostridiales bacterium]|nr:MAG: TIM barrel protein [Clostridiales bacterium]